MGRLIILNDRRETAGRIRASLLSREPLDDRRGDRVAVLIDHPGDVVEGRSQDGRSRRIAMPRAGVVGRELPGRAAVQVGGGGGIRTHGRCEPSVVFKTTALNRSATPPRTRTAPGATALPALRCNELRRLGAFYQAADPVPAVGPRTLPSSPNHAIWMLRIHNRRSTDFLTAPPAHCLCGQFGKAFAVNQASVTWRTLLARAARGPSEARSRWREVSLAQFQVFLREYPRSLEERPRISRKSAHREWMDTALGSWPANAVAQVWTRGRNRGYQIRSV